jgi:hypothetical protein
MQQAAASEEERHLRPAARHSVVQVYSTWRGRVIRAQKLRLCTGRPGLLHAYSGSQRPRDKSPRPPCSAAVLPHHRNRNCQPR